MFSIPPLGWVEMIRTTVSVMLWPLIAQIEKDARGGPPCGSGERGTEQAKIKERLGISGYEALAGVMEFLLASAKDVEAA